MAITRVTSSSIIDNTAFTTKVIAYTHTVVAGQLFRIWVTGSNAGTIAAPTGYTAGVAITGGSGGSGRQAREFYKLAVGGETDFTLVMAANQNVVFFDAFDGVDQASPLEAENGQLNASGTVTTPALTPAAGDRLFSGGFGQRFTGATLSAPLLNSSSTGLTDSGSWAQGSAIGLSAFWIIPASNISYSGAATTTNASVGVGELAIFKAAAVVAKAPPPVQMMQPYAHLIGR